MTTRKNRGTVVGRDLNKVTKAATNDQVNTARREARQAGTAAHNPAATVRVMQGKRGRG